MSLDSLSLVAGLILPVFLILALGVGIRHLGLLDAGAQTGLSRLSYFVLLPAFILSTLATADFSHASIGPMALTLLASLLAMSAIVIAMRPLLGMDGPTFCSLYQGSIRFNLFIALPLGAGLFHQQGDAALAASAVAAGVIPSVANILCVLVHLWQGEAPASASAPPQGSPAGADGRRRRPLRAPRLAAALWGNPLLVAIVAALLLNTTDIGLPFGLERVAALLGAAAVPIGLLAAGAALTQTLPAGNWRVVWISVVLKLVVMPAIVVVLSGWIGVTGIEQGVAVLFMATPCAVASYVLARQMGGNAPVMAAMVAVQTLVSLATLSAVMLLLI